MLKRLLRLKDVARILRIAESGVRALLQRGELPGFRVGGQWRFDEDTFGEWLKGEANKRIVRVSKRRARDARRRKGKSK